METTTTLYPPTFTIRTAARLVNVLLLPVCWDIVSLLAHEGGELTVTEIYIRLRAEQSVVSNHLHMLRIHRIVTVRLSGKYHYYSVNADRFTQITNAINKFFKR